MPRNPAKARTKKFPIKMSHLSDFQLDQITLIYMVFLKGFVNLIAWIVMYQR